MKLLKMCAINWLKKFILLRLLIPLIQSKKTDYDTKIGENLEKITVHDHDSKYITGQGFTTSTAENLTVCYHHVMYEFQCAFTLYSCLNFQELLAQNRRHIWNVSDSNWILAHNHLLRKRTLNHLAKLAYFLNDWVVLWVLICTVPLTVCYYHVTYEFQSESSL